QRDGMDIVEAMKARGADDKSEYGRKAVSEIIKRKEGADRRDTLSRLLSNGAPAGPALADSVAAGDTEIVRILLDNKADVNARRGAFVLVDFDDEAVSAGEPELW